MVTVWQVGMHVSFNWDGLKGSGVICKVDCGHVTVCLDDQNKGWTLRHYDIDPSVLSKYINKQGWNVSLSALKHTKTKLGNSLL